MIGWSVDASLGFYAMICLGIRLPSAKPAMQLHLCVGELPGASYAIQCSCHVRCFSLVQVAAGILRHLHWHPAVLQLMPHVS